MRLEHVRANVRELMEIEGNLSLEKPLPVIDANVDNSAIEFRRDTTMNFWHISITVALRREKPLDQRYLFLRRLSNR